MPNLYLVLTACFGLLALYLLHHLSVRSLTSRHLPPGPTATNFFTGNRIPATHPWRTFAQWTAQYGDIFTLRIGSTYLFVLGQASSAHQIMEKQSAVSSDRPRQIMAGELISDNRRMLILPYGDRWRLYRKVMHETLQDKAAKGYESIQEREARIAMLHLGKEGGRRFREVFKRYAASVVMQITYDYRVDSLDDPLVKQVEECLGDLAHWIRPGTSVLDRYPPLLHLPTLINPWKKEGLRLRAKEQKLFLSQWERVRRRVEEGSCQPCFVSGVQSRQAALGVTDGEGASMAGSLFGAGSDTTASGLAIFVLAMCAFPHVVQKLQTEIDAVCGGDDGHLPTFDDLSPKQTPYLHATVQETLRWRPISAGGFAHKLTSDVEYRGFILPKGSTVVAPHWSISLDATEYEDPHEFKPERFLNDSQVKGTWFAPQRGSVAFGFGRRVCPGLHVAMRSLTVNLACMAWCFDIRHPAGHPAGKEGVDTLAFDSRANSHPLPFEAVFTYRSKERERVVEEENRDTGELERLAAQT